jgi:hypothetical protein
MISLPLSKTERSVFGVCSAFVVLAYAPGAAVHIPWRSSPIPISKVLASVRVDSLFHLDARGAWIIALAGAGLLGFRYATIASWSFRVLLLSSGLVVSLFILAAQLGSFWDAVGLLGWALPLTFQAAFGLADGESFVEGMLKYAAAGLWMLLCVGFLIREIVRNTRG